MTQAKKDQNQIPVILGVLNTDGETPTPPTADPTTHALGTSNGTTGSDLSGDIASRDENGTTTMIVVSEVDGITPVELYVNSSGKLLIKST